MGTSLLRPHWGTHLCGPTLWENILGTYIRGPLGRLNLGDQLVKPPLGIPAWGKLGDPPWEPHLRSSIGGRILGDLAWGNPLGKYHLGPPLLDRKLETPLGAQILGTPLGAHLMGPQFRVHHLGNPPWGTPSGNLVGPLLRDPTWWTTLRVHRLPKLLGGLQLRDTP